MEPSDTYTPARRAWEALAASGGFAQSCRKMQNEPLGMGLIGIFGKVVVL